MVSANSVLMTTEFSENESCSMEQFDLTSQIPMDRCLLLGSSETSESASVCGPH